MPRPGGCRYCTPPVPALSELPASPPPWGVYSKASRCPRERFWPFLPVSSCRRLLATYPRPGPAERHLSNAVLTWAGCGASPLRALSWGRAALGTLRSSSVSPVVASAQPAARALCPEVCSGGTAAAAASPAPRKQPGPPVSLAPVVPSPPAPGSPFRSGYGRRHLRARLVTSEQRVQPL